MFSLESVIFVMIFFDVFPAMFSLSMVFVCQRSTFDICLQLSLPIYLWVENLSHISYPTGGKNVSGEKHSWRIFIGITEMFCENVFASMFPYNFLSLE